jgi:hypothetical protein
MKSKVKNATARPPIDAHTEFVIPAGAVRGLSDASRLERKHKRQLRQRPRFPQKRTIWPGSQRLLQ